MILLGFVWPFLIGILGGVVAVFVAITDLLMWSLVMIALYCERLIMIHFSPTKGMQIPHAEREGYRRPHAPREASMECRFLTRSVRAVDLTLRVRLQ